MRRRSFSSERERLRHNIKEAYSDTVAEPGNNHDDTEYHVLTNIVVQVLGLTECGYDQVMDLLYAFPTALIGAAADAEYGFGDVEIAKEAMAYSSRNVAELRKKLLDA